MQIACMTRKYLFDLRLGTRPHPSPFTLHPSPVSLVLSTALALSWCCLFAVLPIRSSAYSVSVTNTVLMRTDPRSFPTAIIN
jgi:hypothetical protein